jgi:hypothetical protein
MNTQSRTGQKNHILSYSSWEFLYFDYLRQLQFAIVDLVENYKDLEDDEFDLIYMKSHFFLFHFSKFVFENSSKRMNTELYSRNNDENFEKYLENKNKIEENGNEIKKNNGVEEVDYEMNEIFFDMFRLISHFISYNKLYIFEDGSALKLFKFFLTI